MNDSLSLEKEHAAELAEQQRLVEARELYGKICEAAPADADAWHGLGVVNEELNDVMGALNCFNRAISLDPLLVGAYERAGNALVGLGQPMEAVECYWALANRMHDAHHVDQVQVALRRILALPVTLDGYRLAQVHQLLGVCHMTERENHEAVEDFQRALDLQPNDPQKYIFLSDALHSAGRFEEVVEVNRKLLQVKPRMSLAYSRIANAYERMRNTQQAMSFARKTLEVSPNNVDGIVILSKLARRAGKPEDALARLRKAGVGLTTEEDVREVQMELGHVLDSMGRHKEAFKAFRLGNNANLRTHSARECEDGAQVYLQRIADFQQWYSAERIAGWRGREPQDDLPSPVFFVGHPRSGTTLTETVLGAHADTIVTGESPLLSGMLHIVLDKIGNMDGMPEYLDNVAAEELTTLRSAYWDMADKWLGAGTRDKLLVHKHPLDVRHLGIVQRIFPESSVIMALRDPRDVCLSCFMQNFRANVAMWHFNDITQTARAYAAVMNLWLHYRSVIDLRWIETRYEDLVTDFEPTAKRLLDFIGLPWDESVTRYFETERNVTTPSYHDVATPIYSRAKGRWQRYGEDLAPILGILAPFVREFGYDE